MLRGVILLSFLISSVSGTLLGLWNTTCRSPASLCPTFNQQCARALYDDVFSDEDITLLRQIALKGMSSRPALGGPTILDINTGYIRDTEGVENLFAKENLIYTDEDFAQYGRIIRQLKSLVSSTFGIEEVYFTAPTFITRLDGREGWEPQEIHDEYWHTHADMNNTAHYHFSGLLYLSTYGVDFKGGRFIFYNSIDETLQEQVIEPIAGRTVIFTSGPENPHRVERVASGERLVLAFWFTCDKEREFEIFLDGKAHTRFSQRIKDTMSARNKAARMRSKFGKEL